MKRRDFIKKEMAGSAALGPAGCSVFGRKIELKRGLTTPVSPEDYFKITVPRSSVGTMPMSETGKTGIKVSMFTYGSHMNRNLLKYEEGHSSISRHVSELTECLWRDGWC